MLQCLPCSLPYACFAICKASLKLEPSLSSLPVFLVLPHRFSLPIPASGLLQGSVPLWRTDLQFTQTPVHVHSSPLPLLPSIHAAPSGILPRGPLPPRGPIVVFLQFLLPPCMPRPQACFLEALRHDPSHGPAWSGLGDVFLDMAQPRLALPCYQVGGSGCLLNC